MTQLHRVGFFRAIAGPFDCIGATAVGVLALRTSILKADLAKARAELRRISHPRTPGEAVQADFHKELERQVNSAGPNGSLNWTIDFRNMVVHRPKAADDPAVA